MTASPAPDLSPAEVATLARIEAAPVLPESWEGRVEQVARAVWRCQFEEGLGSADGHPLAEATWLEYADSYRSDAEVAIAVLAPAPDSGREAAISRVLALADEWAAKCPPDDWPSTGDIADAVIADCGRAIRAAVNGDPS